MEKNKIICDTDVMIDYLDVNQARHISTKEIIENIIGLDNVVLSAITKMELMVGAKNKPDLNQINKKIHRFDIALINNDITLFAIEILQNYKLSHGLAIPDALIASTAIITNFPLLTYNKKDYTFIKHLNLYIPDTK